MTYANPHRRWMRQLAFAAATVVVAAGTLEVVAHAMKFPAPAAVAARRQVLAAQSEQASRLRLLQAGDVRFAAARQSHGI